MYESWTYRKDLLLFAESFRKRNKRQVWTDDSLSKAEKMLFVGFFFIRKLIECNKVTDECAKSSAIISRAKIFRERQVSAFMRHDLEKDLPNLEWNDVRVDVHQICDKVIHAWWIVPVISEGHGLAGFAFTTDKKRNSEMWLLPTVSITEVFESFGKDVVRSYQVERDGQGRLTYWEAK